MKAKKIILSLFCAASVMCANAQGNAGNDTYFTPYKLNYLPAGAPAWMGSMATPNGLNYNALVDSFNVYLRDNPGARRKSPDTKQVVNHFRRFQKAYVRFVQPDGTIKLPWATAYHSDVDNAAEEVRQERARRRAAAHSDKAQNAWKVISPIVTYDYLTKKVSPAQANIQRFRASRSNPNVLYCGSETGLVFRTVDKGETWTPCNGGEWMAGEITTIDISGTNPNRVLVGAGGVFWISNDGGDNWSNITPQKATYARTSVAYFHPQNDNIILAGDRAQLWRSIDGGETWEWMLGGMVFDIKYSVQNPDVCYVAIEQENTIKMYKSTDGGYTWEEVHVFDWPEWSKETCAFCEIIYN